MKKFLLALVFCASSAFAADLNVFNESIKAWYGAVTAAAEINFRNAVYLPNYGIVYSATKCAKFTEWDANFNTIKSLTTALGSTIKGLEPAEWLSLTIIYDCNEGGDAQVTARIKSADLTKGIWEVWVNGKKQ